MTPFLLGIALLIAVFGLARLFVTANPATLARMLWTLVIGIGGAVTIILLLRGLLPPALLAAVLTGMAWRRMRRGQLHWPSGGGGAGAAGPTGGQSDVSTPWLNMTLNHDTGAMDGTVRQGRHAGRTLDSMSLGEILELLAECRADDPKTVALLEAYLDRAHGPDWRAKEPGSGGSADGPMDRKEALNVLGLGANPTEREIKEAHRELMLKNHPDRGGSDYLAAKINRAKDVLLGQ